MRNRYLDLLRAVATVRVVVYHLTGWAALTIVFPAMSVMFALAGSLMANSLDRFGAWAVERRLRRLLPSLWVIGVIAVTAMLATGRPWDTRMLLWGFPLADATAHGWWAQALNHTWYLRDFLWFVLLSPLALPVFRRFPLASVVTPYLALIVLTLSEIEIPAVAFHMAFYGGAWMLGFAHHDGHLNRLGRKKIFLLAGALAVPAAIWVLTHPGPRGYDLNDIPLGNALWSAAFILIALGITPPMVKERRVLTVLNARALTIYLWHIPIIVTVVQFGERHHLPGGNAGLLWRSAVVLTLLALVTLAVGWIEDLAAGRRPALVPGRRPPVPVSPAPGASPSSDRDVAVARS
ncbi:acyltransferase family protein [Actinoplanes rectilineatus]|uniref:acyltransferase family protein n=1 Tax=Actinoplanes rectilineatus TaxID=113571 RepID=UPI0005F2DC8D|nr:acyltransferase [Actinoplanes rectilineatus]